MLLGYTSLVLWWNLGDIWDNADINPAIVHEQGAIYFWHQGLSVGLTILEHLT